MVQVDMKLFLVFTVIRCFYPITLSVTPLPPHQSQLHTRATRISERQMSEVEGIKDRLNQDVSRVRRRRMKTS